MTYLTHVHWDGCCYSESFPIDRDIAFELLGEPNISAHSGFHVWDNLILTRTPIATNINGQIDWSIQEK